MCVYHYLFNLTNTGDSWAFSNNRFTPGPLLSGCGFSAACEQAVNQANHVNELFHVTAGGTVTLVVNNTETFSWRYGILIDKGALLGGSIFDVAWDGMGTHIALSSGGLHAFQNNFTGSMSQCGIVVSGDKFPSDATPCFNLGPGSGLWPAPPGNAGRSNVLLTMSSHPTARFASRGLVSRAAPRVKLSSAIKVPGAAKEAAIVTVCQPAEG